MRLHRTLGALTIGALLVTGSGAASAQELAPDLRGQLAAITLDAAALPDGYTFTGETFQTPDQLVSGDLTPDELTSAGFVGYYVSAYTNTEDGSSILSYVSAWNDGAAAQAGFDLLEDEARTSPDGTFEDSATDIGAEPRELTSGSFDNNGTTINTVDITFTLDNLLVGVSLNTTDGTEPSSETVAALAASLQSRADGVLGGTAPAGVDLSLATSSVDISRLGMVVQSGFLSGAEAEAQLGLTGSVIANLQSSWTTSVSVNTFGDGSPYVTVARTIFGSDSDAATVVEQASQLVPPQEGAEVVDGVEIEGADSVAAWSFSSDAVDGSTVDSFRVVWSEGATVFVVDIQGAADAATAQEAALEIAAAEDGATVELPASLAG